MFNPISTYRIQFHKHFRFEDFETIIPYLEGLGIKTIYASPIFTSTSGSMHGYDVTNPNEINPEIGTLEQLKKISDRLKDSGMSWMQDIVPNHMALHPDNNWLMDVLQHGESSSYAHHFDIDWKHPEFTGKLMLPVLGSTLADAIAAKDVVLVNKRGKVSVSCYDFIFPLNDASLPKLNVGDTLERINNSPELLQQVLDEQFFALTHWADTNTRINFRRFFTVNSLICLNIQNEVVFNDYHYLIKDLCDNDIFQGLRVDHIDGLYDPREYLDRLRALVGDSQYIVVEKILEQNEKLPDSWPVQGTTGYDFLGAVNNVFTNRGSKKKLTKLYENKTSEHNGINEMLRDRKALILSSSMQGELQNLYRQLLELNSPNMQEIKGIPANLMKEILAEFLIQCPVYKYYGSPTLSKVEAEAIRQVLANVTAREKKYSAGTRVLESTFLPGDETNVSNTVVHFYKRCMQFTGPLMAKGMEDTLMYNYNRFIGHNEVGDTPKAFGYSLDIFHKYIQDRLGNWPLAMNATATHDTKRGEDVRARLNALSDLPEEWVAAVKKWEDTHKNVTDIDSNDAYFIFQAIIGSYPMPGTEDDFQRRLKEYIQKALREAKVHTEWAAPDEGYEAKVSKYIDTLLSEHNGFIAGMGKTFEYIVDAGIINSLAQVILRLTCPGIPDTYQGTELWDLSMVDPDNRRPVDYEKRLALLEDIDVVPTNELSGHLWETRYTGKIKLWLVRTLLSERITEYHTFTKGDYTALPVKGKYRDNILAYIRNDRNTAYVMVLPLHPAAIAKKQKVSLIDVDWEDTVIELPDNSGQQWSDVFTGQKKANKLTIKDVFTVLPVGMLKSKVVDSGRRAGILMPVFSLPSPFGIGDFGPEAYNFIDFLADSGQRYWQLLPLNPTQEESDFSPYSSISGMALNTLFISSQLLVDNMLLTEKDIDYNRFNGQAEVSYKLSDEFKNQLFDKAYEKFISGNFIELKSRFKIFCDHHDYWLNDFALFVVIKRHHNNQPWYEWPSEYKKRNKNTLQTFSAAHIEEINKIKWQQFIADRQWQILRDYCKQKDVELFGDMPFYVSYDSADTWAAPNLFSLDEHGKMTGNAGVPPDYFSKTGQLWNMPTYSWEALKKNNYQWWIRRLRRNLELFDLVRLDHFRAFESYWQVPSNEETAINGQWIKGPGVDFFHAVRKEFGGLPFVAEDLGYEMDDVYTMREKTGLPGMKVLQFAWGANMPISPDAPHNYSTNSFVYTGTHDNNTTKGWYFQETTKQDKERLEQYVGHKIKAKDIVSTLVRLAYSSVARVAILPIQDVLEYNSDTRINMPGSSKGNWLWRLPAHALSAAVKKKLLTLTKMYNR